MEVQKKFPVTTSSISGRRDESLMGECKRDLADDDDHISLILDLETGDPDDVLTLVLAAGHPRIRLKAVTLTPGTREQIGLVRWILREVGVTGVRIGATDWPRNADKVLKGGPGGGGKGFYANLGSVPLEHDRDCEDAGTVIAEACDAATTLFTGGPLHNLNAALDCLESISPRSGRRGGGRLRGEPILGRWVAQGGFAGVNCVPPATVLPKFAGQTHCPTWNFDGNRTAARRALDTSIIARRILVGKNVCHRPCNTYDQTVHDRVLSAADAAQQLDDRGGDSCRLALGLALLHRIMDPYLRHKPSGKLLHDPLALVAVLDEGVFSLIECEVTRKDRGLQGAKNKRGCSAGGKLGDPGNGKRVARAARPWSGSQQIGWGSAPCRGTNTFVAVDFDREQYLKLLLAEHFVCEAAPLGPPLLVKQLSDEGKLMLVRGLGGPGEEHEESKASPLPSADRGAAAAQSSGVRGKGGDKGDRIKGKPASADPGQVVVLTREEFRLGVTCRRPAAGAHVECHFKFPRTFHIRDLGAMTGDDLLLDKDEVRRFLGVRVSVEEKVDGANIGISLHPTQLAADGRPAFRFQKRAHYVSGATEKQFRGLEQWAWNHRKALRQILRRPLPVSVAGGAHTAGAAGGGRAEPGQRIIFGEWLLAEHSKKYAALPDKFLVFDLFDARLRGGRGGFLARAARDKMIRSVAGVDGLDAVTGMPTRLRRVRCLGQNIFLEAADIQKVLEESPAALSVYTRGVELGRTTQVQESRGALGVGDGTGASFTTRIVAGVGAGEVGAGAGAATTAARCEGLYLRVDDEDTGTLLARCKIVHGDFHQLVSEGRWEGGGQNSVRPELWIGRDDDGREEEGEV